MTYNEWTSWLETRNPAPLIAPGLDRTINALRRSGLWNTHRPERTIHIAGTNGKGTTARALEQLLHASGQSVGLFTSPHLVSTCERIRTDQKNISPEAFVALCEKHKATIVACDLTHFEALTLMAFDYFINVARVEWMIFEIGLGGTWDSTNAIAHSTSVLTSIGFDHMHILGNTLESIADNKFGIIQKGNQVFYRRYPENIHALLLQKLEATQAKGLFTETLSYSVTHDRVPRYSVQWGKTVIPLALPGVRSIENISTAVHVFLGLGFDPAALPALSFMEWPARMTELKINDSPCPVYLSGDHNEQGLQSLCEILKYSNYDRLHVVLGLSKNRAHQPFVDQLLKLRNTHIVYTKPQFQGVTPESTFTPFFETPDDVIAALFKTATTQDLIVITGSLYLCGDFLKAFPQTIPV